jgi:hypothetical protein
MIRRFAVAIAELAPKDRAVLQHAQRLATDRFFETRVPA